MTKKSSINNFIEKANAIHNFEYDYSKSVYIDSRSYLIITCRLHGDFEQRPSKHLFGQGCPKCRYIKSATKLKQTKDSFLEKAKDIHGEKYEYLESNNGSKTPISIKCNICNNVFNQIPNVHLMGHGCPKCGSESSGLQKRMEQDKFILKCKEIHGDLYDYSKLKYTTTSDKIEVICNKCKKTFWPTGRNHLYCESGCPNCAKSFSKQEKEVLTFIKSIYDGEIIENTRSVIPPYELDIYLPDEKIAIEYNGLVWHTEDKVGKNKHLLKTNEALKKEIQVFHIFSDEWREKQEIVKSMICHRLKLSERRISARKCQFEILDKKRGEDFFENSHISGNIPAQIYLGLIYKDEVVCCLSLRRPIQKKYGENILEIARFACSINTSIIGGFQKLFIRAQEYAADQKVEIFLTYSDNRFGPGAVYQKAGFELIGETPLDYWYTNGWSREFRFKYRADSEKNLSEKQVAELAGVKKVYGCGSKIWIKKIN